MDRARALFRPLFLLALAGVAGGLAAMACDTAAECALTLGRLGCIDAHGSPTGGGGGTGGTSSTGTTGGGGTTSCTDATTCPAAPPGPCATLGQPVCTGGTCGVVYTPGDAPSQRYGYCHHNTCDATGTVTSNVDDTNVFDSGNPCDHYQCMAGTLIHKPQQGSSCMLGPTTMGYCEPDKHSGILVCAECDQSVATSCNPVPGTMCVMDGECLPMHCSNGMKDFDETDADCGGLTCPPCPTMGACMTYKDCASLVCTPPSGGGKCTAPSCADGRQNGTETDIDCGGPNCPRCGDNLGCSQPNDCLSGVCKPSGMGGDVCVAASCTDGVQNGCETGVDCGYAPPDGGPACPMCPPCP